MGKLKFIFGPSGSGKTTHIYKDILARAKENPSRNYLVIVPDQFTMQSQWELSHMSENGGIMNIDVLSFSRLTHRVLQEVGFQELPVLDDTGKCLVLQHVAGRISDELPLLGGKLHRQGYIHEVKSVISEFMQYGITEKDIDELIEGAAAKGALVSKLRDLKTIYTAFKEYMAGNYITREEKLDLLREALPKSAIVSDSVVVFDGFTGFTPIQVNVIEDIMKLAEETIVSLVLGGEANITEINAEHDLFYLSGKTFRQLVKIAEASGIEVCDPYYCKNTYRAPHIEHLEKNIFRAKGEKYKPSSGEKYEDVRLFHMSTIAEEVHQTGLEICDLLRNDSTLQYRNIAVVTGDIETYAPYVEREFSRMGIPYYLDRTMGIRLNPLVELIRCIIEMHLENFSLDSVMRYLRTGLTGFAAYDVDRLEVYAKATGVRGRKKWGEVFSKRPMKMSKTDESELSAINDIRAEFISQVEACELKKTATISQYINTIYDFLVLISVPEKLGQMAGRFKENGDRIREKEYSQIYRKVMELFEQVIFLMGDEEVSLKEFYEIIDAGIGEIRIGTIPQTVDRLMVGDIERSRVPSVRKLFFLGVNDCNIPKGSDKGGILSDIDRENINDFGKELAPTPRQAMYTQRLYLYLNMTKPTENLYISWADLDATSKSMRPAYICDLLKKLLPGIVISRPEDRAVSDQIVTPSEGLRFLSDRLRRYVEVGSDDEVFTLYQAYSDAQNGELRKVLKDAAFISYDPQKLDERLASKLYNDTGNGAEPDATVLYGSVSKFESFAKCPYMFFLKYGIALAETQEYEITRNDPGNVYHDVMKEFSSGLKNDGLTWADFDEEYVRGKVHQVLEEITDTYKSSIYQEDARIRSTIIRLERALVTSILAIQYQIRKGKFIPRYFEKAFEKSVELKNAENGSKRKLKLKGRIDRADIYQKESDIYVRIVDYKSSSKELELSKVYDGQSLQLPIYLEEEIEYLKNKNPDKNISPAGMLYYHISNPMVDRKESVADAEHLENVRKAYKMHGYVLDDEEILYAHDEELSSGGHSDVVQANIVKNGLGANSKALGLEDMQTVIDYAMDKAIKESEEILGGNIDISPVRGQKEADTPCTYCEFKASCSLDKKIPGYESRKVTSLKPEEIIASMKEKLNGN